MTRREGRAPSQRQLRVGEELRHSLAWILERADFRDPALADRPVTVTEVRISPDLKNATAFVTPLGGGSEETRDAVAALNRASAYLRRELGRAVRLRHVPRLSFEPDTTFDYAGRIDELLRDPSVSRDLDGDQGNDDDGA